jgi:lipopolysaccharide/colanic/teichoic acid biosynthesis glycosyltransferase
LIVRFALPRTRAGAGATLHTVAKRAMDVVIGTLFAMLATVPVLFLAAALAVRLKTWPFFTQQRLGLGGQTFRFLKLRTLPREAPVYASKYELERMRLSRFALFLRRTHVDELPQLFLVPFGRMSLVGPRPKMPDSAEPIDPDYGAQRVMVPQGCTGLWQIGAHTHGTVSEAPEYDLFYVDHGCVRMDIWILWRTGIQFLGLSRGVALTQVPDWVLAGSTRRPHLARRTPTFEYQVSAGGQ